MQHFEGNFMVFIYSKKYDIILYKRLFIGYILAFSNFGETFGNIRFEAMNCSFIHSGLFSS